MIRENSLVSPFPFLNSGLANDISSSLRYTEFFNVGLVHPQAVVVQAGFEMSSLWANSTLNNMAAMWLHTSLKL